MSSIQKPLPPEKPIQIEVVDRKQMRKHLRRRRTYVFACLVQPIKQLFQKTLPEKYRKFMALFSKIKGPEALPKHQP